MRCPECASQRTKVVRGVGERSLSAAAPATFVLIALNVAVYLAEVPAETRLAKAAEPERCRWVQVRDLQDAALPSVMLKVMSHALEARPQARALPAPFRARRRSA